MLSYKQVLLATDLSDETETIAEVASEIATRSKAKLSIIHILEHTPIVYGGGEFSIPLDMNLEEHLAENAKRAVAIIARKFNIHPEDQYVAHGSIKHEIIDLADRLGVDLIVVGSHGRSGIDYILGSTANAVLHAAKCDVLAVRVKI